MPIQLIHASLCWHIPSPLHKHKKHPPRQCNWPKIHKSHRQIKWSQHKSEAVLKEACLKLISWQMKRQHHSRRGRQGFCCWWSYCRHTAACYIKPAQEIGHQCPKKNPSLRKHFLWSMTPLFSLDCTLIKLFIILPGGHLYYKHVSHIFALGRSTNE